jgi:hypothetical protein
VQTGCLSDEKGERLWGLDAFPLYGQCVLPALLSGPAKVKRLSLTAIHSPFPGVSGVSTLSMVQAGIRTSTNASCFLAFPA